MYLFRPWFSPVEVQNEFDRIKENSFKNLDTIKSNNSFENKFDSEGDLDHPCARASSKSWVVHYISSNSDGLAGPKNDAIKERIESCSVSDSLSY